MSTLAYTLINLPSGLLSRQTLLITPSNKVVAVGCACVRVVLCAWCTRGCGRHYVRVYVGIECIGCVENTQGRSSDCKIIGNIIVALVIYVNGY